MTAVNGIGGVFFRSDDPEALSHWYARCLGIPLPPRSYDDRPWRQAAGTTVFRPFARSSAYFGRSDKAWMLNFRTSDIESLVERLLAKGEAVALDPEIQPNGRFARMVDPEGNPIELWQPGGKDPG